MWISADNGNVFEVPDDVAAAFADAENVTVSDTDPRTPAKKSA